MIHSESGANREFHERKRRSFGLHPVPCSEDQVKPHNNKKKKRAHNQQRFQLRLIPFCEINFETIVLINGITFTYTVNTITAAWMHE